MKLCKYCDRPIFWMRTRGTRTPISLDWNRSPRGNIRISDPGIVEFVGDQYLLAHPKERLFTHHMVTCPKRDQALADRQAKEAEKARSEAEKLRASRELARQAAEAEYLRRNPQMKLPGT